MPKLFGDDFITQKYLRQYRGSERAAAWAGVMVHIQTENGVWRTGGSGYTYAGKPDAWILPFEEAVKQIAHCGPEKMGRFLRATSPAPQPNGLMSLYDAAHDAEIALRAVLDKPGALDRHGHAQHFLKRLQEALAAYPAPQPRAATNEKAG